MFDRFLPLLKIVCFALAVLLLFQIVHRAANLDPLGRASIPPLPTLTIQTETNAASTNGAAIKPAVAVKNTNNSKDTNAITKAKPGRRIQGGGPHFHFGFGGPGPALNLPGPIQARVDRIKESEILGPFMRPMPMALLGIADDNAFLRAPNGQTGMIKEGGELAGIKLLRIDINRVLIEENGEKKELTLFNGYGSESLLPKETDHTTNGNPTPNQKENSK